MKQYTYQESLKSLGLFSVESRRLKANIIEVYEIMKAVEQVNRELLFTTSQNTQTRGHP